MKLTVRKCANMDDWWVIELEDHEGRHWLEPMQGGARLRWSGRFSDADVEGTGEEMLEIAKAIKARGVVRFRRCAVNVRAEQDRVEFYSSRNSQEDGVCTLAEADELADLILAEVKP
jgi:hypothetical protein